MKKSDTEKKNCTYIGGQAVMEGVMMRGKLAMATAVRDPEGNIQVEAERITPPEKKSRFSRLPFIRGIFNFVSSLVVGNRVLMAQRRGRGRRHGTAFKSRKMAGGKT